MIRVGQNRIYTPYMAAYLVISLPEIHIYTVCIWFWPTLFEVLPADYTPCCGSSSSGHSAGKLTTDNPRSQRGLREANKP